MAATEKSTLAIEVVTTGISGNNGAAAQLGRLGTAAQNAEPKITRLTSSIGNLMTAQRGAIQSSQSHINSMTSMYAQLGQVASAMQAAAKAMQQMSTQMGQAASASDKFNTSIGEGTRRGSVYTTTLKAMAAGAAAYFGIGMVRESVKQADMWGLLAARLKLVTGSMQNARIAQGELFELSQKIRTPLEGVVQLYTRMARPLKEMGKSHKETKEMVEGVSLALQLGGSTAAEASSVMLQFSQSMRAGRLNGAEFNAVAEGAPSILEAIKAELIATGRAADAMNLKKIGADGKISAELMQKAIARALPQWRKDFEELPVTVDGAMTRIKNAWFKAMGELSQNSGMNAGLVEALKVVEQLIPVIRDELVGAFIAVGRWIKENQQGIGLWWGQFKGLAKDLWDIGSTISGIVAMVFGASDGFSVLGFAVFAVRLAIAGIQDGLVLIGATLLKVGSVIATGPLLALSAVMKVAEIIAWTLEKIFVGASKAAKFLGMDGLAETMAGVASVMEVVKEGNNAVAKSLRELPSRMSGAADDAFAMFARGDSAVQKLLKGEEAITKEIQQQAEFRDGALGTGRTGGGKEDKGAAKATKAHEEAMTDLNNKLKEQVELKDRLAKFGLDYDKINAGTKARIELESALEKVTDATLRKRLEAQLVVAKQLEMTATENERTKEFLEAQKAAHASMESRIKAASDEATAIEYKVATYGMAKGAIEAMTLATEQNTLASMKAYGATDAEIAQQQRLITELERTANAGAALGQLETKTQLDKLLDPRKAEKFGNVLEKAFGKTGKAIGGVIKALEGQERREAAIAEMRKKAAAVTNEKERAEYITRINQEEVENRLAGYGDMAAAGKQFFDENSKGYKTMEGLEKAFRAMELAETIKNHVTKSGLLTAFTGLFVASKATEASAETAATAVSTANAGTQASAWGVTAVVKAIASMPFPMNLVAGAATLAAVVAIGAKMVGGVGGSSISVSEQRQAEQNKGTVFGMKDDRSESIAKSIEILSENSEIGLDHTAGMLAALRNIESSIGGVTNLALRGGLTGDTNFDHRGSSADFANSGFGKLLLGGPITFFMDKLVGGALSKLLGKMANGLFGGKITTLDGGLTMDKSSLGGITMGGVNAQQYTDTKKDGGLFSSDKYRTALTNLGSETNDQFTKLILNMADAVRHAGIALGKEEVSFNTHLRNFVVDIGKVSLKGMTGEQIQKTLQETFSKLGDNMAKYALPDFADFQKVGEGYLQTIVRVASGVEVATTELEKLGVAAVAVADLNNKQGDVAVEMIRDSISIKEALTGVGDIMRSFSGTASEMLDVYKTLDGIRAKMVDAGIGSNLNVDVIRGAGGLDALDSAMEDFMKNMFSEAEQLTFKTQKLTTDFSRLGIAVPKSAKEFRNLVSQLMTGDAASQKLAGSVLALAGAWAEVQDVADSLSAEAMEKAQDMIDRARDDLTEAYERESEALESTRDKFSELAKSLKKFRTDLLTSDKSPLTNMQKYEQARLEFERVAALAKTGDAGALEEFQGAAEKFLEFSRIINASGDAYTSDFNNVLAITEALEAVAGDQVSVAEQSLNALKDQVKEMINLNTSVMSLAEAINRMNAATSSPVDSLYRSVLGRDADAAGKSFWQNRLSSGTTLSEMQGALQGSNEYKLRSLYKDVLGRDADQAGLEQWLGAMNSGNWSIDQVKQAFMNSDEYKNRLPQTPVANVGTLVAPVSTSTPVGATPEDRGYLSFDKYKSGNDALVMEIKSLRQEVKTLREEQAVQTGQMIGANYDANQVAAAAIVEGTQDALNKSKWENDTGVALA